MKTKKSKRPAVKHPPVKPARVPVTTQDVKAQLRADDDGMPPPVNENQRPPA